MSPAFQVSGTTLTGSDRFRFQIEIETESGARDRSERLVKRAASRILAPVWPPMTVIDGFVEASL